MQVGVHHHAAVLFVCLGNICRSPMAEGAFRQAAARHAIACTVDSAGTAAYHVGEPPDPRASAAAAAHGVMIGGQRARQIEPQDFRRFSHIIALDKANLAGIMARRPRDGSAQVSLLLDWLDGHQGAGVPDPYYGDEADFLAAWDLIARATDALASRLAYLASLPETPAGYPPRSS
ncbi:MAG: low molecular weight protein-tyrosine-phosphatase [Erythrobacter sp.]